MDRITKILLDAFKDEKKVLICGNGGSAAQAQHFSGELLCKFRNDRKPLPAIALHADTSTLTAIANDFGYEHVFSRQVDALGKKGDVFIGLSTSYSSPNILEAERVAEKKGLTVIRFPLDGDGTPGIQETHLKLIHTICGELERAIEEKRI